MGRSLSDDADDKSSEKAVTKQPDSDSDSNLDEEEFIVEKILKMRTTKKGKVQCKLIYLIIDINYEIFFLIKDLLKWKGFPDSENTWVRKKPKSLLKKFFFQFF
jgi:hypothetical protein